jgi:hypothetical protein
VDASLNELAATATLNCLIGCAAGQITGMAIGMAFGFSNLGTLVLAIGLAFVFGYALTSIPLVRSGLALVAVVPIALAADRVSITIMEVIDNAFVLAVPGAMNGKFGRGAVLGSAARRVRARLRSGVLGQSGQYPTRQGLLPRHA